MQYLAHTENADHQPHSVHDHLQAVGLRMRDFALDSTVAELFEQTGEMHDLGKYQPEFQQYLLQGGRRGSVHHAIWGAAYAKEQHSMTSALAIEGHHAGLSNVDKLHQKLREESHLQPTRLADLTAIYQQDYGTPPARPDTSFIDRIATATQKELFVRYLFSALVDADWLDTEHHYDPQKEELRRAPDLDAAALCAQLERYLAAFPRQGAINKLRNEVRAYALSKATHAPGFYSLTLPTGMGKTLCSINWALRHAQEHGMKRILVVLPFISIIDQTASVLKSIFGEELVLEHHSNVIQEGGDERFEKKLLATENWDYPIVVTTTIQFFESLFSNKPAACRKIHNLRNSVIIFDEVQTLPKELITPTLTMLEDMKQLLGCSMLFCTATQPAFESRTDFQGLEHIEPLVADPQTLFAQTRRVTYAPLRAYEAIEIDTLADEVIKNEKSALVVFNTKKKAALFHAAICNNSSFHAIHLSTSMCPAHRKVVLSEIRRALAAGERIIVSATQLIEAGVDLDFPAVYREIAPLESIIQSAGRCNREGKMTDPAVVRIFVLTDNGAPDRLYQTLCNFALAEYRGHEERLATYDFFTQYYRDVIKLFCDPDELKINDLRRAMKFECVAGSYRLIKNETTALFIYQYDERSRALYQELKDHEYLTRSDNRKLGQYCVQVYDHFIEQNSRHIGQERAGFLVWHGGYDSARGIYTDGELDTIIL